MAPRKQRTAGWYATVGTVAAAVLSAVIGGMFLILTDDPQPPECPRQVTIEKPVNGQEVDGVEGVDVSGSVCGLDAGATVWLFEYDSFDQTYYLAYDANVGQRPLKSGNGGFVIHDGPIGDPGDENKSYEIVAVVADEVCRREIESTPLDANGNYVFHPLPTGCRDAARVGVLVSQ